MMKINDVGLFRYCITTKVNDNLGQYFVPLMQLGRFTMTMATTYENLIKLHTSNLEKNASLASLVQVKRNHMTAIRGFMQHYQKHETTPVGDELGSGFDQALSSYIDSLNLAERSKRDRRSLLYAWRDTFSSIGVETFKTKRERRSSSVTPAQQTSFERTLRDALRAKNLTPKRAAIIAGVSTSALGRWSRGALPNIRSAETLGRLDSTLGLRSGTLANALDETMGPGLEAKRKDAYRSRLSLLTQEHYAVKESDAQESLKIEWTNFLRFKTSSVASKFRRGKNGKWTALAQSQSLIKPSFSTSVGLLVCPAAFIAWRRVASFLGYLRLPSSAGGFGLSNTQAQTLAWFAVPEALEGYFNFMTQRSDGLKHGGQAGFCTFAISLLNSTYGYLIQCPELYEKLPEEYRTESWVRMCEAARNTASELKTDCHDKSRDPSTPIAPLLALEKPLAPIFDAMRKLRIHGDAAPRKSKAEAIARRDELLFGLLVFNPLRASNIITMTYREDDAGEIFKDAAGIWTIRLNAGRLKNRKRQAGKPYIVKLPQWLCRLVSDYVSTHRKTLLGIENSDYLFLTSSGARFDSLGAHFNRLTHTLIPNCGGFGPHAMRHLVATNWLINNPNDFLTVSELLNDTLDVVMKNYAHLKKDTAFGRYANYLKSVENFDGLSD